MPPPDTERKRNESGGFMQSESCHHLTCSTETVKLTGERLGRLRTDHKALDSKGSKDATQSHAALRYAILIALKERQRQRQRERVRD